MNILLFKFTFLSLLKGTFFFYDWSFVFSWVIYLFLSVIHCPVVGCFTFFFFLDYRTHIKNSEGRDFVLFLILSPHQHTGSWKLTELTDVISGCHACWHLYYIQVLHFNELNLTVFSVFDSKIDLCLEIYYRIFLFSVWYRSEFSPSSDPRMIDLFIHYLYLILFPSPQTFCFPFWLPSFLRILCPSY